ncbi:hypothetical protein DFQ09_102523 [Winogradskyella pacifica]|uniref:Uncharacterized protein n=1 Tax=Winogradskyella pacifica TaxID=664642 RepID=A0A3D9N054_9FLAO|nr:three component ABC system middle component [Winogradskyella pacifica]REE25931.1 hypothetical protein DFQ09_102523 [Winogradskyella pacifica]
MIKEWGDRTAILANLLNPAFCGEILRRFIKAYNDKSEKQTTFLLCFIVLPIVLHKETREQLPNTTSNHLLTWIDSKDALFIDFPNRVKDMKPYTKEALMFLLNQKAIIFNDKALIETTKFKKKKFKGEGIEEAEEILRKAEFLGKWLTKAEDIKTLYSFLRITP